MKTKVLLITLILALMFIFQTNAQDPNILIGLNSPAYGINIKTNWQSYSGTWSRGYRFANETGTTNLFGIGAYGNCSNGISNLIYGWIGKEYNDNYMVFKDGNIGIGTSTPSTNLEIVGSSLAGNELGTFKLKSSTAGQFMYFGYDDRYSAGFIQSVKPGTDQQNILIAPVGGNVGIGTSNPLQKFVVSNGSTEGFEVYLGQPTGTVGLQAYNRSTNTYSKMQFDANQFAFTLGNVGIGTTNPQSLLAVAGTITAKEVNVTVSGWSDFVFAPTYTLPTLEDLEKYINANKHLPDVPTEKDVKENGLNLGQNDAVLLQKVEELTLYIIEQDKKIKEESKKTKDQSDLLKAYSEVLKAQNEKIEVLEEKIEKLESNK